MHKHPGGRVFAALASALTLIAGAAPASAQPVEAASAVLRLECGGIGVDESERMRAEVAMHALTLLFSTADGSYVTDVETRVDDPLGARRAEASCGPIGQIDVPEAGRYRITATYAGVTQEHWVELTPSGGARLSLRWQE